MNSAYNQMPLHKQSSRLTQFLIGNHQYEFNRIFYGISIGPAAFSAFMSKIFRPLILNKIAITYFDNVFMQLQTKDKIFINLEKYHQKLLHENMRAVPDKSHFFSNTSKIPWTYFRKKHYNTIKISHRCNPKTPTTSNKKKITRNCLSRNTPIELLTRKTTVEIPQNINFFLHKMNSHQD